MLRMFRLRRWRVVVILAVIIVLLLVKFTNRLSPGGDARIETSDIPPAPKVKTPPKTTIQDALKEEVEEPLRPAIVEEHTSQYTKYKAQTESSSVSVQAKSKKPKSTVIPTIPSNVIPDRKATAGKGIVEEDEVLDEIHPIGPPGRQEFPPLEAAPTTIHWEKQIEHFPVPTESIIPLPTGPPVMIPRIQHRFNDETPDAKINRERRQNKVKQEFVKAWEGYKQHAWLHDELSPKTGAFRDPFCGWAATLVDSLDTLWIMGLQEEFEEAARAVDLIDFTTSPRADIPLFETTIRYLGGLLAAYDVSGGKYKNLLNKAVELGDILIGAFDTPNRMPLLYYQWKPAFASQPHRASQRTNIAELGSLSMEFTRLTQLTKDPRYYDAVARVTNALSDFQDRGTNLGSVFPNNIDASGCNKSAPPTIVRPVAQAPEGLESAKLDQKPEGYKPNVPTNVVEPRPRKRPVNGEPTLEMDIVPDELNKLHIVEDYGESKRGNLKRQLPEPEVSDTIILPSSTVSVPVLNTELAKAQSRINKYFGDWDCTPQGLDSFSPYGGDTFSMGGGQDSTYEYFPKQYLLLAGREEKYKKLYLKTLEDVKKWMLFRPMVPDNRDILFSGAVETGRKPEDFKFIAEVEHLTCFIGGMIGMSSRIFGIEDDLEIAKKLTDGCVWAYGSTPSGIMPEGSTVVACKSVEHCTWNETAYFHELDPLGGERESMIKAYDDGKAALEAKIAAQAKLELEQMALPEAEEDAKVEEYAEPEKDAKSVSFSEVSDDDAETDVKSDGVLSVEPEQETEQEAGQDTAKSKNATKAKSKKHKPVSLEKREVPKRKSQLMKDAAKANEVPDEATEKAFDQKSLSTEAELRNVASAGRQAEIPLSGATATPTVKEGARVDPQRPQSHEDYVAARIKQGALPPGFIYIRSRSYILRPEAIESVWYMYRITGESTWQDKGWTMFEAIINATSTTYGHSAIHDVMTANTTAFQTDSMESFWLAETLKYFYLLYSTPDVLSLDDWVLNTEAHPFKRE